jgi:hypothetical protein
MDPPAPPPAYSSTTQKPGDIERLSTALLTFADDAEEDTVKSGGDNLPNPGLSKDASKPQLVPNKVPETVVEDRARQLTA